MEMILLLTKDKGRRQTRGIFGASENGECKSSCSNNKTLSELQTKAKTKKQFMFTERSVGLVYYIQIRFCHDKKKSWGNHDIRMIFRVWTDVWYALYHRKT